MLLFQAAVLCTLLSATAAIAAVKSPVVCPGTQESEQTSINSVQKFTNLREKLSGCQYIIGDVHLMRIDQRHFGPSDPELNFDFLSSIREVTGCVKVVESCFSNALEFPNLQVIRGTNCGNSSLVLQFDPECTLKTPHVAFPSLRVILGSAVVYHVNSCYIERYIRFNDLSYKPAVPSSLTRVGNCTELQDKCHESCTIWPEDGKRHCWGPELRHCQPRSHCRTLGSVDCSHQLCFADSQGAERCCSDQCLGGCFGPSPSQCFGCNKFDRNGTCVLSCDPGLYYDPGSAQMVKVDTDVMVPYGPVCVAKCPDSYFTEDGNCVRKCTTGHKPNADRVCVPAETARLCELDPKLPSIVCDSRNPLLEGLTNDSRLCTEYDGSLTISDDCLLRPMIPNTRQITLNHLYTMFSKLKVFRGDLQVQLLNNASITNLSFFSRMERLETRPGQSNSGIMLVLAPYVQFLGLSSLRFIEKSIIFYVRTSVVPEGANISFCPGFIPKPEAFKQRIIDYGAGVRGDLKPVVRVAQSVESALKSGTFKHACPYQPDTCDPQCEPRFGCWGPGPANCVRCRSVRTGATCAESCDSVPGWFDARNATSDDATSIESDRLCSPCHNLCSKCNGPGRGNCTECQKGAFQDGSHCTAECNRDRQFADTTAGVCRPCPSVCVNLANGNATCTGNMTSVGPGGCQFCTRVMVVPLSNSDSTPVLECVATDAGCPQGYYAAVLERGGKHLANFSDFLALQQQVGFPVSVCRKCAPHCLSCSGSDFFCTTCRFYSVDTGTLGDAKCETRDSPKCRDGFYPDHETRTCRRCNSTCNSCSGPGEHDCLRCIASKYALLADADVGLENENLTSSATLSCVDACPQDRPHAVASQRGLTCSSSPHGLRASDSDTVVPLTAILLGLAGLAAAFATVILSAWCCLRRRRLSKLPAEEEKEELEPILNRGYLTTISENELLRGPEVGSGAFGTVYKGEWMPADSDGRRTTVAIKILADSGDHSMSSELLEESRIMASVDHPHCVRLVGICMTQPLQLVTQFMPLGNLRDYLRCRREPGQIGGAQLLRYAAQIASGMGYLERLNIIHRDLACRNVLVSSSRCVRITDFGLAKALDNASQEYQATGGKLPVKWLALESLVSRRFTHKSDVWSYGVTLWEIFTFGEPPYPNVKPQDLADYLEKGERLPQPAVCMLDVYMLMIKCWMLDDHHRPAFDELEANFTRMCGQPERYVFTRAAARNPSHCSGASNNGGRGGSGGVTAGSGSKSPRHSNNNRRSHSQDELDDAYVAMDALGGAGSDADEVFDESPVDQAVALTARPLPVPVHQLTLPHHPPVPVASVSKQRSFSVAAGGRRRATGPPPPLNNSQNQYTMDPCQPGPSDDYLQPMRPPVRLFDNPLPLPPRRSPPSAPLPPSPPPPAPPPPIPPPPLRSPNRPVFANPEYFFQHSGGRASFSGGDFQPAGHIGGDIATAYGGGHTPNPASSNDSGIASPKFAFTKV